MNWPFGDTAIQHLPQKNNRQTMEKKDKNYNFCAKSQKLVTSQKI